MVSQAVDRRAFSLAAVSLTTAFGAAVSARAEAAESLGISSASRAIHQEVQFRASPAAVYGALTDARRFDRIVVLSGAIEAMKLQATPCEISPEPGGRFSLFAGYITGRQIELTQNIRIVQAWRAGSWAAHVYSIARFELADDPGGARLVFDHTGFPDAEAESLARGWRAHYWEPLAKLLA